jgi:hypothetical protein
MTANVTPKTLAAIFLAVIALLAAGGWFGLVSSQRSTAAKIEAQTADEESNLAAIQSLTRSTPAPAKAGGKGKGKDKGAGKGAPSQPALLALAFPTEVAMPSILLQVQRLAGDSGVSLDAFAPTTTPAALSGYESLPIEVKVSGRYRGIQKFVHALRAHAGSSNGRIHANGRLFAVETVGIMAAADGLPLLTATILLDAFVYSGVVPPAATETPVDGSSTTTEGATP